MPFPFQNSLLLRLQSLPYLNIGVLMGSVSLTTFSLHSCFLPLKITHLLTVYKFISPGNTSPKKTGLKSDSCT